MQVMGDIPCVPGLFVAGVFSGALSTVSSGLNSLAAVVMQVKAQNPKLSTLIKSYLFAGLHPGKLQSQADRKEEDHLYKTSGCWIRHPQLCGGLLGQIPTWSAGGSIGNIRDRWRTRPGGVYAWHVHSLGQLYCKPNVTQWTGTLMTRDCFFREPSLEPSRP